MFAHELPKPLAVHFWRTWQPSGTSKTFSPRDFWEVRHLPTSPANRKGKQHYVVLATNRATGAIASAWRVGTSSQANQHPYLCRGLPEGLSVLTPSGDVAMAAGPKVWTEERIAERFAQGRGQGEKENYIPWVWVQEFASKANQTRIPSLRLKRTIHTFSYLERAMHTWHEYSGYVDYREQFPMDRRITMGAASQIGIRHPVYPVSRCLTVMMLDALVIKDFNGKRTVEAWDAKPHEKLHNERIRDKLKLHKAFCAYIGIEHSLFTESTLPPGMAKALEWARGGLPVEGEVLPYPSFLEVESERLLHWLRDRNHQRTVDDLCANWDALNCFEAGMSLRLFKLLLWTKKVYLRLDQTQPWSAVLPDQRFYIHKEDGRGALLH